MTSYLSIQQVLFIHTRVIDQTGGGHGIRDLHLLQSALSRPKTTFDKKELYPTELEKAAALIESLVNNHPLIDGNKRTGITVMVMFLEINDKKIKATNKDIIELGLGIAKSKYNYKQIVSWLKTHTK
jgi:death-on-curing protein